MSIVAPKERKHLSADALFHVVRSGFATIPDPRGEDVDIALTDARKTLRLPRCLRLPDGHIFSFMGELNA